VTSMLESAAAAVGASMLLGGFSIGLLGVVLDWPRPLVETRVIEGSYLIGIAGLIGCLVDIIIRYIP